MAKDKSYVGKHARGAHAANPATSAPSRSSRPSVRGTSGRSYANSADEFSKYSRASHSYKSGAHGKRKSGSKVKKILLGLLLAVLLVAVAGTAYGAWYLHQIDRAISYSGDHVDELKAVTSNVNLSEPFYMLVMGSDSREDIGAKDKAAKNAAKGQSDVIILLRVDAPAHKVTMVSIPRDTPYYADDGTVMKINETYNIGGAPLTIKAVEDVTGVDIAHFAEVRFSDLEGMVDALGGVTVNVDTELSYKDALTGERVTVEPGEQHLTGQQAQIFVRARHEYDTDQDMHRQQNVRQLATAMVKSLLAKPMYKIPSIVLKLAGFVSTDLKSGDIIKLVELFTDGDITLYSCTGPSLGDINEEAGGIWLCFENPEGWKQLMEIVDAGEDPSGFDVNATANLPETEEDSDVQYQTDAEYLYSNDDSYYFTDDTGGYYDYSAYQDQSYETYGDPSYEGDSAVVEDAGESSTATIEAAA